MPLKTRQCFCQNSWSYQCNRIISEFPGSISFLWSNDQAGPVFLSEPPFLISQLRVWSFLPGFPCQVCLIFIDMLIFPDLTQHSILEVLYCSTKEDDCPGEGMNNPNFSLFAWRIHGQKLRHEQSMVGSQRIWIPTGTCCTCWGYTKKDY